MSRGNRLCGLCRPLPSVNMFSISTGWMWQSDVTSRNRQPVARVNDVTTVRRKHGVWRDRWESGKARWSDFMSVRNENSQRFSWKVDAWYVRTRCYLKLLFVLWRGGLLLPCEWSLLLIQWRKPTETVFLKDYLRSLCVAINLFQTSDPDCAVSGF